MIFIFLIIYILFLVTVYFIYLGQVSLQLFNCFHCFVSYFLLLFIHRYIYFSYVFNLSYTSSLFRSYRRQSCSFVFRRVICSYICSFQAITEESVRDACRPYCSPEGSVLRINYRGLLSYGLYE